ncbi:MAG: metal ABC transporter substrate-binding protein [Planctomycetota bacterium]
MTCAFRTFVLIVAATVVPSALFAGDPLRVVTTTPDLADIARQIGAEHVNVSSLTRGTEDLHKVRPRPRLLNKLARADVLIEMGLDMEHSWLPALLQAARNPKVQPGQPGFINVSAGIQALDVPTETTRKAGPDLHRKGNPHFNLSPTRGRKMIANVLAGLVGVLPDHRDELEANHKKYMEKFDAKVADWKRRMAPFKGAAFIEYHASWAYFAKEYELRIVTRLEPKPGVAPSPKYLAEVAGVAKREGVGLITARPANIDLAGKVAASCDAKAIVLPLASAASGPLEGYIPFLEHVVKTFESHLKRE